jgi:hypothetical protein
MKRLLSISLLALLAALASGCGDKVENSIVTPTATGMREVGPPQHARPQPSLPKLPGK